MAVFCVVEKSVAGVPVAVAVCSQATGRGLGCACHSSQLRDPAADRRKEQPLHLQHLQVTTQSNIHHRRAMNAKTLRQLKTPPTVPRMQCQCNASSLAASSTTSRCGGQGTDLSNLVVSMTTSTAALDPSPRCSRDRPRSSLPSLCAETSARPSLCHHHSQPHHLRRRHLSLQDCKTQILSRVCHPRHGPPLRYSVQRPPGARVPSVVPSFTFPISTHLDRTL